ncbi:unnamed protein product [Strongylus vulgaris]|uniref:Uncharacterized protein n=1 Tax=Strongylus vulgaris TaxID=40348 RepID=A0A3P7LSW9_STRVU|nr:unnamed protein product [Strongylus vulgaris]
MLTRGVLLMLILAEPTQAAFAIDIAICQDSAYELWKQEMIKVRDDVIFIHECQIYAGEMVSLEVSRMSNSLTMLLNVAHLVLGKLNICNSGALYCYETKRIPTIVGASLRGSSALSFKGHKLLKFGADARSSPCPPMLR